MKLNKVKITNFRQYRDVEIEFGNKINIIQGNNGTGKTTLLNALSWCLYGSEIHDYGDKSSMTICNNKAAFLAKNGERVNVTVEIGFEDSGKLLTFKRSQNFVKNNNEIIRDVIGSVLEAYEQNENDIEISNQDAYIIDRIIPKEIEEYFFFDGALLGKYFQDTKSAKIKNAIFEISQLNLIENIENNIHKVIEKYNKKLKKIAPEIGQASEKISYYDNLEIEKQNELEEAKTNVKSADEEIKNIENELIDKNSESITKLVKEDQQIEKRLNILVNNIKTLKEKRKKLILDQYPILLSYDIFVEFLEKVEDSRKKRFIPPEYTKNFIKDLLDEKKCICGVDLEVNKESFMELEKILNQTPEITDRAEDITRAGAKVENLISGMEKFNTEIKEINLNLSKDKKENDEKLERRRNIASKIKFNPIEEIQKLQEGRESYMDIRQVNNRKIGALETKIASLREKRKEWEQRKNKEAKLTIDAETLESKIKFAKKSKEAINKIGYEMTNSLHDKIQSLTKEKFIKIIWKEDEFVDIKISKDYEVSIVNKLGEHESPGDLSDGEKLCLGLCFMSAIHNISGYNLPIIMDTPLGNLDIDIRKNIAKFLPEFIEEKQAILLVTGTEYTDDFRNIIHDNVSKEYLIEWKTSDEGKESKVKEV